MRKIKDALIERYYNLRIDTLRDPYKILFRKQPYKYLFILGHMRSGSSFFTHILNSNPAIIGYGETHLKYSSDRDFKQLMSKVYWHIREYDMNHKYVLDKILHDNKFLDEQFLTSEQLYTIFLIREPKRTIASIIDLKPHWSIEKALDYYIERLATLERYAEKIDSLDRSIFITHDSIINQTDLVFTSLQDFLKTPEPFSEQYQVLRTTGLEGIGDRTTNIKAGRIVREQRQLNIEIPTDVVDKALESFERCSKTLAAHCRTL
jgi:hypothetical protein